MNTAGITWMTRTGERDRPATPPLRSAPAPVTPSQDASPDEPSSEDLVLACQAGSAEAFDALVERHSGAVFGYLLRFTGNAQDAEDLTQDTFLKAHRGLPRFHTARAFVPWLFTIARRTALNHFRAQRPTEELHPEMAADEGAFAPDESADRGDMAGSLWELARRLKPRQYEALWLHYGEGLAIDQVARVMRRTRLNIRVLLHRGRQELRRRLSQCSWAEEVLPELATGQPNLSS